MEQVKEKVAEKVGEEETTDGWTGFVQEVGEWLLGEKAETRNTVAKAIAGLISYGATTEEKLQNVGRGEYDKFTTKLAEEGVPKAICDLLFEQYVARTTSSPSSTRKKSPSEVCDEVLNGLIPDELNPDRFEIKLQLDTFEAPVGFKDDVRIPAIPKSAKDEDPKPHVLLFGVEKEDCKTSKVYNYLKETAVKGPCALYGTSGSGKTRSVMEFLSHNYGFYFVSDRQLRSSISEGFNFSSRDTAFALLLAANTVQKYMTRHHGRKAPYGLVLQHLQLLLLVRAKVFLRLRKVMGRLPTPYEWMLAQLHPDLLTAGFNGDVFYQLAQEVNNTSDMDVVDKEMMIAFSELGSIEVNAQETLRFHCFIDEAQLLLDLESGSFQSESEVRNVEGVGDQDKRSMYSAVVYGFTQLTGLTSLGVLYPVLTGTGHRVESFELALGSYVAKLEQKPSDYNSVFSSFAVFNYESVREYLGKFKDFENENKDVVEHVCKWLAGRPRWSATFAQFWLCGQFSDGNEDPMLQAIQAFVDIMTKPAPDHSSRWSKSLQKTSAYVLYDRTKKLHPELYQSVVTAAMNFSFTGKPVLFATEIQFQAVDRGFGILSGDDSQASLEEPLLVEACLQYIRPENFKGDELARFAWDRSTVGIVFEQWLLPWFQSRCSGTIQEILASLEMPWESDLEDDSWTGTWKIRRSAYGVVAVDAKTAVETMQWIDDSLSRLPGSVPPFCFPDSGFGPDLMCFLFPATPNLQPHLRPKLCVMQMKFTEKPTSANFRVNNSKAKKQAEAALASIQPENLFNGYANQRKGPKKGAPAGSKPKYCVTKLYNELFVDADGGGDGDSGEAERRVGVFKILVMPFRSRETGETWKLGMKRIRDSNRCQDAFAVVDEQNVENVMDTRDKLLKKLKTKCKN